MWDRRHGRRFLTATAVWRREHEAGAPAVMSARARRAGSRQLMTASLQAISEVSVPALQGTTVPLLANTGATDAQTYTVTSSNPDISASVAQGPFWTLGVSYNDSANPTESFTGSLTFQLFQNLTPNTVSMIEQFTNDGYYVNTGNYFPRIVTDFDSPLTTVIQGARPTIEAPARAVSPIRPYANENVQELALTGVDQLALANSGGTDSNDTQFFINTGPADSLGYNYTVFGQLVAGQNTLNEMATQVPVQNNPATGEDSQPVEPADHHLGVALFHEPRRRRHLEHHRRPSPARRPPSPSRPPTRPTARPRRSRSTSWSATTSGRRPLPQIGNINFKPYANPVSESTYQNMPVSGQLSGQNTYPDTSVKVPLTYSLASDPSHGTVSNFNASTGTFTYTPDPGYVGTDTFKYEATAYGPDSTAAPGGQ